MWILFALSLRWPFHFWYSDQLQESTFELRQDGHLKPWYFVTSSASIIWSCLNSDWFSYFCRCRLDGFPLLLMRNGQKRMKIARTRIKAMGIMKITLWSRSDTWEPDTRMWHIQFYGSIYDSPHTRTETDEKKWRARERKRLPFIFYVLRRKRERKSLSSSHTYFLWKYCILSSDVVFVCHPRLSLRTINRSSSVLLSISGRR